MPDTASLQALAEEAQVRAEMARSRLITANVELAKREERFANSRAGGRLDRRSVTPSAARTRSPR